MSVKFIAEVSSNHNKDLKRCLKFIDTAARIGCDAVKFQLFKVAELFAPEALKRDSKLRARKNWELPIKFIPILSKRSRELGLQFSCTPFYLDAIKELKPYIDFYKISSYDLLRLKFIKTCGQTKIPVVLSTGMAKLIEVKRAVEALRQSGCRDISLLHCVSNYPALLEDCNLHVIDTLRRRFNCPVGWSDHTNSEAVIYRAVYKWNADIIEFHLDLEGKGKEFGFGHCWLPEKIEPVIKNIKLTKKIDGRVAKIPIKNETIERNWRADPLDGFRPLRKMRKKFSGMTQ